MFDKLRSLLGKPKAIDKKTPRPTPPQEKPVSSTPEKTNTATSNHKAQAAPTNSTRKVPESRPNHPLSKNHDPVIHETGASEAAPEIDLVLGIDLGTSCSKVVIGDHGWLGQSYAVPIGDATSGIGRFLRVTRLKVGSSIEGNLKLRLMDQPNSKDIQELVALYLAGIIRDSLDWFKNNGPKRYAQRRHSWNINIGFPAKQIKQGPLVDAYNEIAQRAANLALSGLPLELLSLRAINTSNDYSNAALGVSPHRIQIYPEIGAQLAGYVNSPYKKNGSMILIDVGAGTLDVSTLILRGNNEEDIVSFHFCEIGPLGAMKLLEAKINALNAVESGSVQLGLDDFQSGEAMPESLSQILSGTNRDKEHFISAFNEVTKEFGIQAIYHALRSVTAFRKSLREAHISDSYDPWPNEVRFFFTGGGSRSKFFRDHFVNGAFENELLPFTRWEIEGNHRKSKRQGLRLESLPAPDELKELPKKLRPEFDRLSVAHGLAYGSENLMKITASIHAK